MAPEAEFHSGSSTQFRQQEFGVMTRIYSNLTGRCDPYVVNGVIDASHPEPTFTACLGRAFTSRIRLLGRK